MTLFWFLLGVLVVAGGLAVRARLRSRRARDAPVIDDEALRRIERTGTLGTEEDEPLDLEEVEEEERRFWDESWDEPEPF